RGIGVTSLEPSPLAPDLPALAQSGLAGFEVIGWNGFVAPKNTPQPVIAKLNAAVGTALKDADVQSKLRTAGYEPAALNAPDAFAQFIAADTKKWIDVAAGAKIKAN